MVYLSESMFNVDVNPPFSLYRGSLRVLSITLSITIKAQRTMKKEKNSFLWKFAVFLQEHFSPGGKLSQKIHLLRQMFECINA